MASAFHSRNKRAQRVCAMAHAWPLYLSMAYSAVSFWDLGVPAVRLDEFSRKKISYLVLISPWKYRRQKAIAHSDNSPRNMY